VRTDHRIREIEMSGQGSAGNVIAALASFFVPGLGQLLQGRLFIAVFMFILASVVWVVTFGTLGWVIHLWSVIDAAVWRRKW
jgi:TM2 domain-containing membrane protein YozV